MPDHARCDNTSDESSDIGDLLDLIFRSRPSFHADAACKQAPANVLWFLRSGHGGKRAKRICSTCPAFEECRVWSLAPGPELDGIWAGLSRVDRAEIRREKTAA